MGSEELGIVPALEAEQLFFDGLDLLGEGEESLEDFVLRGLVGEVGNERMEAGDSCGKLVAGLAHALDGGGSVHGKVRPHDAACFAAGKPVEGKGCEFW